MRTLDFRHSPEECSPPLFNADRQLKPFQVLSAIVIGGVVDPTLMETGDTGTDVPKSGVEEALAHPP